VERKKRQKLMGRDKGSLTEQIMKQRGTTTLIRKIYKTNSGNAQSNSHHPMPRALPSRNCLHPSQLPHQNPA